MPYLPKDPFSKLHIFLQERLDPDDMTAAEALIEELTHAISGDKPLAMDALSRRRVTEALARTRVANSAAYGARFPDANRLGHSS